MPTLTQPLSRSTVKSVDAETYGAPSRPCWRCTGKAVKSGSFSTTSWHGAFETSTTSGRALRRESTSGSSRCGVVPKAVARRERLPATLPASEAPSGPARCSQTALGLPSSIPATSASATGASTFWSSSGPSDSRKRRNRKRSKSCIPDFFPGNVVAEQPLVALGDRRSGPLAAHVLARPGRIGERPVVEALDVGGRAFDRATRALAPCLFIRLQSGGDIGGGLGKRAPENVTVLDRHVGALGEKRHHRVTGVAEQAHAADRPALH